MSNVLDNSVKNSSCKNYCETINSQNLITSLQLTIHTAVDTMLTKMYEVQLMNRWFVSEKKPKKAISKECCFYV